MADKIYEDYLAEARESHRTKNGKKLRAQEILMHGIAGALGYWTEQNPEPMPELGGEW